MSMKRRIALAGTAAVAGLTLAACGSGGSEAAKTKSAPQVPVAATAPATPPAPVQNPPAAINGWPAYTYAKDTAPGQITGQGVGGTWFAMAPDGTKAGGGKVPAPAGGTSSGDQGYSSY